MTDTRALLASKDTTIAVIGATDSKWKYGGRIYCDLKAKGYDVWPVNPNRETVDGDRAYPDLAAVPAEIDVVDVVVPSDVGMTIVDQMAELGLDLIWLQPGAESPELIDHAKEAGLEVIHHRCIMVET